MDHNSYSAAKFHNVQRTWFGGSTKLGSGIVPYTTLVASGSSATVLTRYYPKGPIRVLKVGYQCVATASAAANATGASDRARIPVEFYKSSAAGAARTTLIASTAIKIHPVANTLTPRWSIGSKETIASAEVEAGRFLDIYLATAESNEGTAAAAVGTTLVSGSFAYFIDWVPKYDPSNENWNS